jgi:hypothetical protein
MVTHEETRQKEQPLEAMTAAFSGSIYQQGAFLNVEHR